MNKWERVRAVLEGREADGVPLSLWRHYHLQDRTAEGLARATLEFYHRYDLDLIKVTPSGLYGVEDWGADIRYYRHDFMAPHVRTPAIAFSEHWQRLPLLSPREGALGRELRALELIGRELGGAAPYLMTLFSPITTAYKLAGERALEHLREHPDRFHGGLEIIAQVTVALAKASLAAGASGIFFATQLATTAFLTWAEYEEFGMPYDLAVLEEAGSPLTILHIHGEDIFFQALSRYPVDALSWHDRRTFPSLGQALGITDKVLVAGLDTLTLATGSPQEVAQEVGDAVSQTAGRRLILAPGCVVPPEAPSRNLQAARDAVNLCRRRGYGKAST